MSRKRKPLEVWAALSPSQKAALCCHTGTPYPLWTHLNFTVASMKALQRRGLWYSQQEGGGPTPLGLRVVACAPKVTPMAKQIKVLMNLTT